MINPAIHRCFVSALALLLLTGLASAQEVTGAQVLELTGSIRQVHDPVIAEENGRYYLYATGSGIPTRCSDDLRNWKLCGLVFLRLPAWAREHVPGATSIWAPDISFFNGKYHLYYSVSTFGSNTSAIGLATNTTLDMNSPEYAWRDEGMVIASQAENDWNAIDPNLVIDENDNVWLAFGSFWGGIKMRRIDAATGKLSAEDETLYALAWRPETPHAIEAPFMIHRDGYYYLFVSFDHCCRGADSTYHIRVGRSADVTGPYLDREGTPMLEGGGTVAVPGTERWPGSGHNAVFSDEQGYKLVYHAYDPEFGGTPTLRIEQLEWDEEGWPVAPSASQP
jgi:arabinan endo-1,5-alpha-L-arabinosidase